MNRSRSAAASFLPHSCLIPASAFYEWKKIDAKTKQPYAFTVRGSPLFAFAGLWDAWKDGQGHWLQSFSIVTTEANELMQRVHTRMPVILHSRDYDRWLSREVTEQLPLDLLRPYEAEDMEMTAANPLVGNVRNNGPNMLNSA
ncbi:SOS response-associated peptidase [Granulicella rosea]|uniref:SOS response-associated peptidase n=1 Tax=Granulicella rosea TaxID=474952 RepID=UPI001FE605F8|nr:SOS response-associated peptidase [Granulicella rosea]